MCNGVTLQQFAQAVGLAVSELQKVIEVKQEVGKEHCGCFYP